MGFECLIKRKLFFLTLLIYFCVLSIAFIFINNFVEEKPKVVVVLRNLDLQYWEIIKAGAEKGFKDFGIDGKVIAPKNGTVEEQRRY